MLFFKPQIPIWDRIKGIPMRTAMTVLKEIFEYKDFTPTWPENSIKHKGSYLVWITFNSSKGIAKVHIDQSIDFEIFVEAFQSKFANSSTQGKAQSKSKGKGKSKSQTHRRRRGKVPFYLPVQAGDQLGQGVWGLQVWEPHWSRRIGNAGGSRKMATLIHEHRKRTHDEGSKKQFTNHEVNTLYASLL